MTCVGETVGETAISIPGCTESHIGRLRTPSLTPHIHNRNALLSFMGSTKARACIYGLLASWTLCHSFVPVLVVQPKRTSSVRWRGEDLSNRAFSRGGSSIYSGTGSRSTSRSKVGQARAGNESGGDAATPQESEVFDWLAANAGIRDKTVSLGVTAGGYRGLMADEDVQRGQVMLEVPSDICLWSSRDGVVSGLYGQTDLCWEAAGDLRHPVTDEDFARGMTWDVRLALALLEATSSPQIGGKFWSVYGRLLPQPHTVTVPFCLPERLLVQLHNGGMVERARKQVQRMRSLYPDLMRTLLSHPKTAIYAAAASKTEEGATTAPAPAATTKEVAEKETDIAPMALLWAFAMVRSRAFVAENDRFAFVPFLDMANHGFAEPAANFTYTDGRGGEPGVFRLQAMRNISAGEEVTISYGEQLDAEQLMVQYGFPAPSTLPLQRHLCDPDGFIRDSMATARGGDADAVPAATAAVDTTDSGSGSTAGGQGEGRVGGESVSEEGGGEQAAAEGEGEWDGWGEETRVGVMNDLFRRAQERFAREAGGNERQFEIRVRKALPLIPPIATKIGELGKGGDGESAINEGARAYLEQLQAYRSEHFPTTEEQDRELLSYCVGDGRGKVDSRLADVVRYRIGRKESHSTAVGILEEFLAPPPSAPPTTPAGARSPLEGGRGDEAAVSTAPTTDGS